MGLTLMKAYNLDGELRENIKSTWLSSETSDILPLSKFRGICNKCTRTYWPPICRYWRDPAASRPLEHRPQYRSIAGVPKSLVYILIFQRHSAAYSVYILTRRLNMHQNAEAVLPGSNPASFLRELLINVGDAEFDHQRHQHLLCTVLLVRGS